MTVAYAWAPITKSEKQNDGTVVVYGPAASSALDRDHQRLDDAWLDEAMPQWMAEGGNVREQHDAKRAVGVGIGLSKGDDGAHYIAAHIVDPVAVKKVETGVLKGFSVGIKAPRVEMGKAEAPNGLVTAGSIVEISVVDRPCNPTTLFEIAKADGAEDLALVEDAQVVEKSDAEAFGLPQELYERLATPVKEALARLADGGATVTAETVETAKADGEAPQLTVNVHVTAAPEPVEKADLSAAGRRKAAASGAAMSDGSYPIKTKADLRKAIKAVGRGGADHDDIRKHIITRAKALGLEAMVPDNWNSDGSLKDATKADDAEQAVAKTEADTELVAKAEQVLRDVRALVPSLAKADDGDGGGEDETGDINGATAAIAAIAQLIISEAESLAQGNFDELCDIQLLCSAAEALRWFKCREEAEQAGGEDADMGRSDDPTPQTPAPAATDGDEDGVDEADDDNAGEASKSETPTLTKADVTELIEAAVAKAESAAEERTKALAADLVKAQQTIDELKALPQPGGPVLTRTTLQEAEARKSDATLLRAQASEYLAKADQCSDRYLADGYREKAQELLAKADA
jgi:phage head maturation protease